MLLGLGEVIIYRTLSDLLIRHAPHLGRILAWVNKEDTKKDEHTQRIVVEMTLGPGQIDGENRARSTRTLLARSPWET